MKTFTIANRTIGAGSCFIIAEAGVNHNGREDFAARLIDAAAAGGADAVKFQTFRPELLASAEAAQADYQARNTGVRETQLQMLSRLVLPEDAFRRLAAHAKARGIIMLSTAFDEASADFLEDLGIPAFKIPSGEVPNHPLIAHVARKGRPLIMSSGMSDLADVEAAVAVVRAAGAPALALLHCVTNYPADPSECNLRAMDTMRERFAVPVGWSDHTDGITVSLAAAARGAAVIEKHLTLDRALPGPDHAASSAPDEFAELVRLVRVIEAALGDGRKVPTPAERTIAMVVRRSLHVRHPLPAGHVLTLEDVVSLRPAGGIPPSALAAVVGRALKQFCPAGHRLMDADLA